MEMKEFKSDFSARRLSLQGIFRDWRKTARDLKEFLRKRGGHEVKKKLHGEVSSVARDGIKDIYRRH